MAEPVQASFPETSPETSSSEASKEAAATQQKKLKRSITPGHGKARGWEARIRRFSPAWFSCTMGCGIPSVLLFLLPWQHIAFRTIGCIYLIFDSALFLAFSIMIITRYTLYPEIFPATLKHEQHSMFLGTVPMGFITISTGIALYGNDYGLDGSVMAASVLYWIASVLSVFSVVVVPYFMMTAHSHRPEGLTAAWLLPFVPPITIATSGSSIAELLIDSHPTYALNIVLSSYIQLGCGLILALCLLVLYLQRLILHRLPGSEVIVSTFLPLGPAGQGGYALLRLGAVCQSLFPVLVNRYPNNTVYQTLQVLGPALHATGIVVGLLLFGWGLWWMCQAVAACATHWLKQRAKFNLGFWAFTFPLGSLNLLTYGLASTFDNITLRVMGTIMTASVCLLWLVVSIPTVYGFKRGTLFQAPCLELLQQNKLEEQEEEAGLSGPTSTENV